MSTDLVKGRDLFYKSIEDKRYLMQGLLIFESLKNNPDFEGRAVTYIGALTALKGKHAFWPMHKYQYTQKGLAIMDEGIEKSPDDIEALFIHGMTCFYLPFFFHRSQDAQEKFKKIITLLPDHVHNYDPELVKNVIQFIKENIQLDEESRKIIKELINNEK
ncbi:hypothetical protein JW935_07515 [candidate division KSB1 bacterium]|nr:hypothetical protein [candidate division KSB1 bacterium]